jgi:sodium-dependent dicarboxylate transporter 2/3/5
VIGLILGLTLFVGVLAAPEIPALTATGEPLHGPAKRALAATILIAVWWITEPIPFAATSLLPVALFPLLGVMSAQQVSASYTNDSVHLFLGGFILALGIEKWGLHRRIALRVIWFIGMSPRRLLAGMMTATAFLSLWISNTAAALVMLPIAAALVETMDEPVADTAQARRPRKPFANSLLLGVAYGASVGGIGTPIGTPPNLICLGTVRRVFPNAPDISVAQWMMAFLPLVAVMLFAVWLVLQSSGWSVGLAGRCDNPAIIRRLLTQLGPMTRPERLMMAYFALAAGLWIFRRPIDLGFLTVPGWSGGLQRLMHGLGCVDFDAGRINDATVAVAVAALTFLTPAPADQDGRPRRLMDWATAVRLPWSVLLLFGGGFAVADVFHSTGLSLWVGNQFQALAGAHPVAIVAAICTVMTFLTEVTSNTAITAVTMPILAGSAHTLGVHPLLVMLPAAISASFAFMLPVATPPNAVAFATGRIRMLDMAKFGLVINLIGIVLVTGATFVLAAPILGIAASDVSPWAAAR